MKYIVCLNQKSVIFILLLNSKTHSSGNTLNLEKQPSERSWLVKARGCAGEQECTAGHCIVHLKPLLGTGPHQDVTSSV